MAQTLEAIYKNGIIEPAEKLDMPENQRLRITVEPINHDAEPRAREQCEKAVAILRRRGTRRYTREEVETILGPIDPIDRELAKRGFEKLGGTLSEEIIRDRGEY